MCILLCHASGLGQTALASVGMEQSVSQPYASMLLGALAWAIASAATAAMFRWLDARATSFGPPVQPFRTIPGTKKPAMEVRDASCLVVISGGVYDVEPLMRWHPGGKQVLENARRLDITDAFMSYHPPEVVTRMLPGFFVRKATH